MKRFIFVLVLMAALAGNGMLAFAGALSVDKALFDSLAERKQHAEAFMKKRWCQDFGVGNAAAAKTIGTQQALEAMNPGSKMNLATCSGTFVEADTTFSFVKGHELKRVITGHAVDEVWAFTDSGNVNLGFTLSTQPNIMVQIVLGPDTAEIVDITLPGMDVKGSMVMLVDGKGVTVSSNALIAYLNGVYRSGRFINVVEGGPPLTLADFGATIISNNATRRDVLSGFAPVPQAKKESKTKVEEF